MNAKLVCFPFLAAFLIAVTGRNSVFASEMKSPVKTDETVTFYTTAAWPSKEPGKWEAEVHGIIFEEEDRPLLTLSLGKAVGFDPSILTAEERLLLRDRVKYFIADHERGKSLPVTVAGELHRLPDSLPNGHFRQSVVITSANPAPFPVNAVLREGDARIFSGSILPMEDSDAPMVISDVDDTIKITNVLDRRQALTNTFCRPFVEVPGMAAVYQGWATGDGAGFQYVSGSPWQLYVPLETFVKEKSFPPGAWHLKHLRISEPETIAAFLGPQHDHKLTAIRPLFERWKKRRFVLVGDTGEQDPEIYARLAAEYQDRVHRIFLRNVTGETRDGLRMKTTFKETPGEKWQLFEKAGELPPALKP